MLDYKRKFSHTHFRFAESIEQHNAPWTVTVIPPSGILDILQGTYDNCKNLKKEK